jgi:tRNA threonylcarbamoyladenosine biosynthesis protein TsaE
MEGPHQPAGPGAAALTAASAEATRELGRRLGAAMKVGDVVALIGPLGSGKTTFAQGLALGLEVPAERHVASPTFALVNQHPGRVPFLHADLYRLETEAELAELGLEQAFDEAAAAIEWADRFPAVLPADRLTIRFTTDADGLRRLDLEPQGSRARELASALGQAR